MNDVKLNTLAGGAVEERFNMALEEVLNNILDPNTDPGKARRIQLNVTLKPHEDRSFSVVEFGVKTTLQPPKPVKTGLIIDTDGKGRAVAAEYSRQIPGQGFIDETTGEIVNFNDRKASNK